MLTKRILSGYIRSIKKRIYGKDAKIELILKGTRMDVLNLLYGVKIYEFPTFSERCR